LSALFNSHIFNIDKERKEKKKFTKQDKIIKAALNEREKEKLLAFH
jgi:hypothetical protein